MDVNLKAVFFLCQAFARRRSPPGRRQDRQHRLDAVLPGRHPRAVLHRDEERRRRPDPAARQRMGGARASTSTPSRRATSPPTTPGAARGRGPQPAILDRIPAGRWGEPRYRRRGGVPRFAAHRTTSTAPSSPSMVAGSHADLPRLTRPDGPRPGVGMVRLGLVEVFSAHGALYVAEAMRASRRRLGHSRHLQLVRPDQRDRLTPRVLPTPPSSSGPARDAAGVVVVRTSWSRRESGGGGCGDGRPSMRMVNLTVTEKGYCHDPATGPLNREHPDIVHDLAHPRRAAFRAQFSGARAGAAAGRGRRALHRA